MSDEEGTGGRGKEKGLGIERGQVEEQVLGGIYIQDFSLPVLSRVLSVFSDPITLYSSSRCHTHPVIALKGCSHFLKGMSPI